jgi:hypothetical protein
VFLSACAIVFAVTTGCADTPNHFQNNFAVLGGGDISVIQARMLISHAQLQGSSANGDGGAIAAIDSNLTMLSMTVTHATAKSSGGGVYVQYGEVWLENATLAHNKAGDLGGGLAIDNASLHLVGVSHFEHNSANMCGGGIAMQSVNITDSYRPGTYAADLLVATNNSAASGADRCLVANTIAVVNSSSNLDSFVTSLDSEGGLLHLTLNVSGPQGQPADDPVQLTIFNSKNMSVSTQWLNGKLENGLQQVDIKLRQPPGRQMGA